MLEARWFTTLLRLHAASLLAACLMASCGGVDAGSSAVVAGTTEDAAIASLVDTFQTTMASHANALSLVDNMAFPTLYRNLYGEDLGAATATAAAISFRSLGQKYPTLSDYWQASETILAPITSEQFSDALSVIQHSTIDHAGALTDGHAPDDLSLGFFGAIENGVDECGKLAEIKSAVGKGPASEFTTAMTRGTWDAICDSKRLILDGVAAGNLFRSPADAQAATRNANLFVNIVAPCMRSIITGQQFLPKNVSCSD